MMKLTLNGSDLVTGSGTVVGQVLRDVDGSFYFWPKEAGGAWSAHFMKAVGELIEKLNTQRPGAELIAEERVRQISQEGHTLEKDTINWPNHELAQAAICYAMPGKFREIKFGDPTGPNLRYMIWPWSDTWWKPKDRIRDLVRAGALIAAEIDRLQRKEFE